MYSYQIRGNLIGFFMTPIIQIPFLLTSFYISNFLEKKLQAKIIEPLIYFITGMLGLIVIEWIYVGHTPWGSDAWQLLMFIFWGGAVVFSRIITDVNTNINKLRKLLIIYSIIYSIIAIVL